ncbi:MAG: type II CAAX endopeptidase family protein [Balneolaceae bacterium]
MNPFFNKEEFRPRAVVRIPGYIFFSFLILTIGNSIPFQGFEYFLTTLMLMGVFWIFFRGVDNRPSIKEAGISVNKKWLNEFWIGSLIGLFAMGLIFLIEWMSGDIEITGFGWQGVGTSSWGFPVLMFMFQMICLGFYEELISRSYLVTNFKDGFTNGSISTSKATILAVIASSAVFGIAHAANPNATEFALINILCAGIMLAIPFVITGRLSYSVGLHFSWNFFQGGVFGFRVSGIPIRNSIIDIQQGGNPIWTGGSFGPEGGLIGLMGILLISIFFLFYFKKKTGKISIHPMFKRTYLQNKEMFTKTDELA